jgi:uncharacterized protein
MKMDDRIETGAYDAPMRLKNDTVINVAQLLKENVGAVRKYAISLDWFALDRDLMARDVTAEFRLTRISNGLLAAGAVRGTAIVECVRCLEMYDQPFETTFDQEYRPTIDVRSGVAVPQVDVDDELGRIDENHELDIAEPLRQVAIVALPMQPICREDCPGLGEEDIEGGDRGDRRLSVLARLLKDDTAGDED